MGTLAASMYDRRGLGILDWMGPEQIIIRSVVIYPLVMAAREELSAVCVLPHKSGTYIAIRCSAHYGRNGGPSMCIELAGSYLPRIVYERKPKVPMGRRIPSEDRR